MISRIINKINDTIKMSINIFEKNSYIKRNDFFLLICELFLLLNKSKYSLYMLMLVTFCFHFLIIIHLDFFKYNRNIDNFLVVNGYKVLTKRSMLAHGR